MLVTEMVLKWEISALFFCKKIGEFLLFKFELHIDQLNSFSIDFN